MPKGPKVRIEDMPHLVRPGMPPADKDRAVSQNFDHINVQLRNISKALNAEDDVEGGEDFEVTVENVSMHFRVREKKKALDYNAIVKFDSLTATDEDEEAPLAVKHYVVQVMSCDASGDPVDFDDDGDPVIYKKRVDPPKRDDARDRLKRVFPTVPRPKKWYMTARVIPVFTNGRGEWSEWTDPLLPVDEALPKPPGPTFVSLTFDRKGGNKNSPWRGKILFTPVRNWDVPGGDIEDDLRAYRVKVEVNDGGGWEKHWAHTYEDKDDGEADENILAVFRRIRRRDDYRVWFRSIDRWNRRGDWEGPYPSSSGAGVGDTVGDPVSETVRHTGVLEWRIKWDEPTDSSDVDRYRVDVKVGGVFFESVYTRARHLHYKGDPANKGTAHRFEVFAEDEDGNSSSALASADEPDVETIPGDRLEPGSIDITPFASSIRPVGIVGSLPTLPNAAYPEGAVVFLTTDNQLYVTKTGSSWVRMIAAGDMTGQITETQIGTDAVTTPKINANAITSNELAANSVIAGKVAAGAISATEISVSSLSAINANLGTVTAGLLTGVVIDGSHVFAEKFSTDYDGGQTNYIEIDGQTGNADAMVFIRGANEAAIVGASGGIQICRNGSEDLGFWGATPVARGSAIANLTIAGSPASNNDMEDTSAVSAAVHRNFGDLHNKVNQIIDELQRIGLFA